MRSGTILSAVYPVRIKAVEVLLAAADRRVANGAELRSLSASFDKLTPRYADAKIAMGYSAFADLLRTLAMLVEWRAAVLSAEVEADRFLRSARERHHQWCEEFSQCDEVAGLAQAASSVKTLSEIGDVGPLCGAVGLTPLPIGILADEPHRRRRIRMPDEDTGKEKEQSTAPPQLTIAFLRFTVDGTPARQTEFLTPREAHDLEIEVRVSRWPDKAEVLRLSPVTIEAHSTYEFPDFCFRRPAGDPPYLFSDHRRAILHVAQALRAQPFEFKYLAEFEPPRIAVGRAPSSQQIRASCEAISSSVSVYPFPFCDRGRPLSSIASRESETTAAVAGSGPHQIELLIHLPLLLVRGDQPFLASASRLMTRGSDCLPLREILAPGYFFLDQRHDGIVGSRGDGGVNCRDGRRMLRYGVEKRLPAGKHARMRSLQQANFFVGRQIVARQELQRRVTDV